MPGHYGGGMKPKKKKDDHERKIGHAQEKENH